MDWLSLVGFITFINGFVIGLVAVTVIDMHGFLARHSPYWTEATTRTHRVTKTLLWIGITLAVTGGALFYGSRGWNWIAGVQSAIAGALILNGIFLSFRVSPIMPRREQEGRSTELLPNSMQMKLAAYFVVSFTGLWSALGIVDNLKSQ